MPPMQEREERTDARGTPGDDREDYRTESTVLEQALEHWMALYRGPLVGLLRARGAAAADAVELAQETFAEAWCGAERFRGALDDESAVGRWLAGIARNLHRARGRADERLQLSTRVDETTEAAEESRAEVGDARRPALRAALARLKPEQREVIWMHYMEETPVRRVAALLEVSEKTVEGRLYRARVELRRILDSEEVER